MKRFDCLSPDCSLFGPHLLEASAGTGKTFTIEHVFVRLILSGVPLEEILVVTFTRSATRELKHRIRANIEKALSCISGATPVEWPYLSSFIGSEEAIFSLSQARKGFDGAQIFTIHGFCYRMLKEFAFEAGSLFPISDPDEPFEIGKKMRSSLAEFWASRMDGELLCPEQIALLFGKFDTLQELGLFLARSKKEPTDRSFASWHRDFVSALKTAKKTSINEEFDAISGNYKAHKGDFIEQLQWLSAALEHPEDPIPFRKLIAHQGTIFSFLDPKNRRVKAKDIPSDFFDWARDAIGPIIQEASEKKKILAVLSTAWKEWEKKWLTSTGLLQPDEIIEQMRQAIDTPPFLQSLQKRFQAVIIDEFQDTDPLQWDIFQKAFLQCRCLYLVGDPKQSIYRFRSADVYTYFLAKEMLGEQNLYQLDTNFRSSKELIGALNALFSRNWLPLPKTKETIFYPTVLAGSAVTSHLHDKKKALHWILGSDNASYQETFLPFTVAEIEKLQISHYKSVAILVKDRYELQSALELLRKRGIPCVARSHQLLSETFDFCALRELFEAIDSPQNESARLIAEHGPFPTKISYSYWKNFLEEKGLAKFFCAFFQTTISSPDLKQTMEELFAWEQREGFSFVGLKRFFSAFDYDEGVRRRADEVEDAVQILTLHVSKGLEFDIVFALALASQASVEEEEQEEINAEKNRQLYVAMTRAKKRLYVPFKPSKSKRLSPMDLFSAQIEAEEGPFIPYLGKLAETHDVSYEQVPTPFPLGSATLQESKQTIERDIPLISYTPSYIQSFTSLACAEQIKIESSDPLPRGKETGTIVHEVFEAIFQAGLWKDEAALDLLVEKKLRSTSLSSSTVLVQEIVRKTLSQPLFDGTQSFSLRDVENVFAEMEFLYTKEAHYITGSMDLVFILHEKVYLVDWKTNVLNSPTPEGVDEVMKAHDYELQASLYKEALRRHFGDEKAFGGVFYIFVRTGAYVFIE